MIDLQQAMLERHSVRSYTDRPLDGEVLDQLRAYIDQLNARSGLHLQLVLNEPEAFGGMLAHYGRFSGVTSYLALVGLDGPCLEEDCGYFGEKFVLYAQRLGLNSCWVGGTFKKVPSAFSLAEGEKLCLVIALGYGQTQGCPHRGKPISRLSRTRDMPEWFVRGVEAAALAPTALNQQKFSFELTGDKVLARAGIGPFSKVDLGIAKLHFELGSGRDSSVWL